LWGLPFVPFINALHQRPERAKYHSVRQRPRYSREAAKDWNAGIPPASVYNRTEQVGTEHQNVLANVRWVTDRHAVTSAQADNWIANTHWQNQNALRFGRVSFADAFSAPVVGER
jgi:hypothetical protein